MNQTEPSAPPSPERSEPRVLDDEPCTDLPRYLAAHGMQALDVARRVEPEALVDVVERSGLRGRGGAGSPPAPSGGPSSPTGPTTSPPPWW